MDVEKYLKRIAVEQTNEEANLNRLFHLQKQHLLNIPFENLDIHLGKKIILDYQAIFDKVIIHKRGGFCYELNGLFYSLLKKLGYSATKISARVRGDSGRIGQEGDHMAILVQVEDTSWLVDVGFGKFSFCPLKVVLEEVQEEERGGAYKISKYDETYHGVYIKESEADWRLGYLFTDDHRNTDFFEAMCHYQQTSSETNFTKRRMITIPTLDGRITLTDTKLKIRKGTESIETPIVTEDDFRMNLKQHFNMPYEY